MLISKKWVWFGWHFDQLPCHSGLFMSEFYCNGFTDDLNIFPYHEAFYLKQVHSLSSIGCHSLYLMCNFDFWNSAVTCWSCSSAWEYITVAIFWLNKFEGHSLIYISILYIQPWPLPTGQHHDPDQNIISTGKTYIHPPSTSFTLYARTWEQLQHMMQLNHDGQH
jgi:hypothetical protein